MSLRFIFFAVGLLLLPLTIAMVIPAIFNFITYGSDWEEFIFSALLTGVLGLFTIFTTMPTKRMSFSIREAFLFTTISWTLMCCLASLPFFLSNEGMTLTDALFETTSALTTTGATVLSHLSSCSPGLLVWRSLLQWLGGIGIVVMALTILPILKIGGMQLFRTESSDQSEKILPRVTQIASGTFTLYFLFTIVGAILLNIVGINGFDAFCHALTAIATGGLSTQDNSIQAFNNPAAEIILIIFMIIGSSTFTLFIKAWHGDWRSLWTNSQLRVFLGAIFFTSLILAFWRFFYNGIPFLEALRTSLFNVTSIITTTGYVCDDYTLWGSFPLMLFFVLSFIGGCTGSTSGGIKVFRFQVLFNVAKTQIAQLRRPHGIFLPYYNKRPIPETVITSVLTFFILYGACYAFLSLGLALCGLDLITCLSGAVATLGNVGPGLGSIIGPMGNFATLPVAAKWLMMGGMILGRLELLTVFILFMPSFWRK